MLKYKKCVVNINMFDCITSTLITNNSTNNYRLKMMM